MIMRKTLTTFLAVIVLSLTPILSRAGQLNEKATEFTLMGLDNRPVSLSQYKGKVVFLDFWASWCPPCKEELPELNSFLKRHGSEDVVGIAVNIDKNISNVTDFLSSMPALSPNLIVLLDPDSKVISSYKARAMPTSYMIDREGVIRHTHFGYTAKDPEKWEKEIGGLLKKETRQ